MRRSTSPAIGSKGVACQNAIMSMIMLGLQYSRILWSVDDDAIDDKKSDARTASAFRESPLNK